VCGSERYEWGTTSNQINYRKRRGLRVPAKRLEGPAIGRPTDRKSRNCVHTTLDENQVAQSTVYRPEKTPRRAGGLTTGKGERIKGREWQRNDTSASNPEEKKTGVVEAPGSRTTKAEPSVLEIGHREQQENVLVRKPKPSSAEKKTRGACLKTFAKRTAGLGL